MAQLACIGPKTVKFNVQAEGDIVGVFEDTHEFSSTERDRFDIVPVAGTKAQVEAEIEARITAVKMVGVEGAKGTWMDGQTEKQVMRMPKFPASIADLSPGQKTALTNKTGIARAAAFGAVKDNLKEYSVNHETMVAKDG